MSAQLFPLASVLFDLLRGRSDFASARASFPAARRVGHLQERKNRQKTDTAVALPRPAIMPDAHLQ
jgi:hypothetical protein